MAGCSKMKPDKKIILLKRKFQSLDYIEAFIAHYQGFINTGLNALSLYKDYKKNNPSFIPTSNMDVDERLWDSKVAPNFLGMKSSSVESLNSARKGKTSTVRSLAGDFRGLSKSMDGIREAFMDVLDPEIKKNYMALWKITSREASNIEKAINQWWKDSSILDEEITGIIDEDELLHYLLPGETIN
jgi:hypothetical protein